MIGRGAMGAVYRARDPKLERDVALKLVRSRRLSREAHAMAKVTHTNVVAVYDAGELDDGVFIAMELIDGDTLARWLATPRAWREVIGMFAAVGRGLAAAHAAGIVHRDFKPENVLVDRRGRPAVTDFGLAVTPAEPLDDLDHVALAETVELARLGRDAGGAELDAALDAIQVAARAAWPELAVPEPRFAAHLATLVADAAAPAAALATLNAPDVHLSLACAEGVAAAIAILDRDHLAELRPTLSRMGLGASAIDETLQVMREELLVPRPEVPPRIVALRGRPDRPARAQAAEPRGRARRTHPRSDRRRSRARVHEKDVWRGIPAAFTTALAAQSAEDRLLLEQRFRHKLTVEELGVLYAVHAGTISRWVAAARERLVKATRSEMMKELGVGRDDLSSILRLIQSEIEITLASQQDLPRDAD